MAAPVVFVLDIFVFFHFYVVLVTLSAAFAVENLSYENFKDATSMSTKMFALFCKFR